MVTAAADGAVTGGDTRAEDVEDESDSGVVEPRLSRGVPGGDRSRPPASAPCCCCCCRRVERAKGVSCPSREGEWCSRLACRRIEGRRIGGVSRP